ncbi:TPR_REGION domain-containing protein [Candidatus Nitrotoga sp. BS]|uniref:O-linked N-acetylglucosamine transferase, SPINDLY family protein n=1 Tax=Candidatus Nitrotoga sp. BS TaxID=2890408 RepID=UPI001EF1ABB2|nr:tetratricopeptide repeat protein [Candidatus Nitrotoga sp. BS]CAH1208641.1 TPR_REGION domain-containing protein [Candidatus Nitrotoga sp. BS]
MQNKNQPIPVDASVNPEALYQMGLKSFNSKNFEQAINYFNKAIRANSQQPHYWLALGFVSQAQGRFDEAAEYFCKALELNPSFAQAYYQLGTLYQIKGRLDEAVANFRLALKLLPDFSQAWNNLGSALNLQGKIDEATVAFLEAVRLKPDYVLAYNNLGSAYQSQARIKEAESCYRKSIELQPDNIYAHLGLGHVLIVQWKMSEAEKVLRRALFLDPDNIQVLNNLAYSLKEQSKNIEAASVYQHALSLKPNGLKAFIGAHLMLPAIYSNAAELSAVRKRYTKGMKTLRDNTENFLQLELKELFSGLSWTNFYLAYQGQDDRFLQVEYAQFVADILRVVAPDLMQPIKQDPFPSQRRLRIGFLSSFMRDSTVGSYFKSWVTSFDRDKFEVYCYHIGHIQDQVTQEFSNASDCYKHLVGDVDHFGRQVKKDQLDILIYPEIGMDQAASVLAAMRLAPIQCTAWGHPVTTGHVNIDYFFSSVLMEPENAQAHYSEQLILLEGIGTYYLKPVRPSPVKRSDFLLPEERVLYLCPQSLYKIHPDNDKLMLEILARNKNAVLVFFQATDISITHAFMKRLESVMDESGMEKSGQIKILPRMAHENYLRVNMLCDVMLDTLHWSGGNTTLDALACGLPVVTMPGQFMRGRQSYGMLKCIGLNELIANDHENYIEIATRLGTDSAWHQQIVQRITTHSDVIFADETPLCQLEQFFLQQH